MRSIASEEDIRRGKVSDVYFGRTRKILDHFGIDRKVPA
jgi:hypothetical protein